MCAISPTSSPRCARRRPSARSIGRAGDAASEVRIALPVSPSPAGRGAKSRMILGIGSDLCDVRRIEKALERFGERFIRRVYTDTERRKAEARVGLAATYAKRFAAKEAC